MSCRSIAFRCSLFAFRQTCSPKARSFWLLAPHSGVILSAGSRFLRSGVEGPLLLERRRLYECESRLPKSWPLSALRFSPKPPSALVWRRAKSDISIVRGKEKTQTCGRTLRLFPFQAREAWTFPSTPSAPPTSAGHRRRSHRYAIRPRRSETLNCHYMMRGRRGKQQQDRSGVRGCWCVEHPGSRHQKISPGFAMKRAPQRIMSCGLIEPQIPPLGVKPSVGMTG